MQNIDKWLALLPKNTIKEMVDIQGKLKQIEKNNIKVYPPKKDRFKALELIDPKDLKVVILGQDPYHGKGQAMGLSFSVNKDIKIPPSLQNIFKELNTDLGVKIPDNGDLTPWAEQGVLLLNSCLTVEAKKPASHKDLGWQNVTMEIIKQTLMFDQPIVYLCWGRFAEKVILDAEVELANENKTAIGKKVCLTSTHPSPYSANKPATNLIAFMGSKPFSRTNDILIHNNLTPINWSLN